MFTHVLAKTMYHLLNRFYIAGGKKDQLASLVTAQFGYTCTYILCIMAITIFQMRDIVRHFLTIRLESKLFLLCYLLHTYSCHIAAFFTVFASFQCLDPFFLALTFKVFQLPIFASCICLIIFSHCFLVLSLQLKFSLVWILILVWLGKPQYDLFNLQESLLCILLVHKGYTAGGNVLPQFLSNLDTAEYLPIVSNCNFRLHTFPILL